MNINFDGEVGIVLLDSPELTRSFGFFVGSMCSGGEVFLLSGDLGAGKTCFTQGLAPGLGVAETTPVTSPTFVLHCQYPGRLELNHIDAYRLEDAGDVSGLGFDEFLGAGDCVCAVEWPEFIAPIIPEDILEIELEIVDTETRRARLVPKGAYHLDFLKRLTENTE